MSLPTVSEETEKPKKFLPIAIIASLVIVTILYIFTAMALTLMARNMDAEPPSVFTRAFLQRGSLWAVYPVGTGTLLGLASVIMSGLFAVPRILYAISNDGLIFNFLGHLHSKTQTPTAAILLTGCISSVLVLFINLNTLVEIWSTGTLFCFTFVAVSICIIRYNELLFSSTPQLIALLSEKTSQKVLFWPIKQKSQPQTIQVIHHWTRMEFIGLKNTSIAGISI